MQAVVAKNLAEAFGILHIAGISYESHPDFYQVLIKVGYNPKNQAKDLAELFSVLHTAGISYESHAELYHNKEIIDNAISNQFFSKELNGTLCAFIKFAINFKYFNSHLLFTNCSLAIHVLQSLKDAGYALPVHEFLFDIILERLSNKRPDSQIVLSITEQVCFYSKNNKLVMPGDSGFDVQVAALKSIIEENIFSSDLLESGPLNKSIGTIEIENLLEDINKLPNNGLGIIIDFNAAEHYILRMPNKKEINLSLLIKNSNLTQITLDAELISGIGSILDVLVVGPENSLLSGCEFLHEAQRKALQIYTTERYKNINALFRSEALDASSIRILNLDTNKDRLACFLLGCLLNDAANKINASKALLPYQDIIFDRGERLTQEVIDARIANPVIFPALTSFSASKEGSLFFHKNDTIRTKLENSCAFYSIINECEKEVIFAQGEQVVTTQGPGYLISEIKRSPTLEPRYQYFSDLALTYAFEHHLSKPYSEGGRIIQIDGKNIVRPNHNLTHTYRVMLGINSVIQYFSNYAADAEFKDFCGSLSNQNIEWLRVAAAFSITGRESEISAMEDLKRYDEYRAACAQHFNDFVGACEDVKMKERISNIVRYMGNPYYEEGSGEHQRINVAADEGERKIRNFYHRILTVAHKLDLPRCYSANQYSASMIEPCNKLSIKSEAQKKALMGMIRYHIELTKAHGGRLNCDIGPAGELFDTHTNYQAIYAETSLSAKRLFQVTQTVSKPKTEAGLRCRIR